MKLIAFILCIAIAMGAFAMKGASTAPAAVKQGISKIEKAEAQALR
ncbi:MAG: hypothetical protein HYX47_13120 [Burkholderiales bacterium]|jgi:hypothetical protein|nr:hypothetical protein [Burkholderiales bacterium]